MVQFQISIQTKPQAHMTCGFLQLSIQKCQVKADLEEVPLSLQVASSDQMA